MPDATDERVRAMLGQLAELGMLAREMAVQARSSEDIEAEVLIVVFPKTPGALCA